MDSNLSFLVSVESRDSDTLIILPIREWILPGTAKLSDCWKAFNCLSSEAYRHLTVNHSINLVDPDTGGYTDIVELAWREVRQIIPRFGIRKDYFV